MAWADGMLGIGNGDHKVPESGVQVGVQIDVTLMQMQRRFCCGQCSN